MKVYRLTRTVDYSKFDHPSDMRAIVDYLESRGEIFVSIDTIETLYYKFSDECACSWRIVYEESLREFAEWLDEYEM